MSMIIQRRGCKRCGWTWVPRVEVQVVCPRCKSPYWNRGKGTEGNSVVESTEPGKRDTPTEENASDVRKEGGEVVVLPN